LVLISLRHVALIRFCHRRREKIETELVTIAGAPIRFMLCVGCAFGDSFP